MAVKLLKVSMFGYRSCVRTQFTPHRELSVLIGKNGSGKSNLLNGIQLLQQTEITSSRWRQAFSPQTSKIHASFEIDGQVAHVKATLEYSTDERGLDSLLSGSVKWNFESLNGSNQWIEAPLEALISDKQNSDPYKRSVLSGRIFDSYKEFAKFKKQAELVSGFQKELKQLREFISTTSYYSASQFTNPTRCPTHFEIEKRRKYPSTDEGPHKKFLYDLYYAYRNRSEQSEFDEFINIVGPDGLGLIENFDFNSVEIPQSNFQVGPGGRVIQQSANKTLVIPTIKIDGANLSPSQLSEGTFRTLAIVFYLLSDKASLLLIEEPEVCIHHGLLLSIISLIVNCSHRKQIIISTHSDFVLDSLQPEQVFIVTKRGKFGSKVRPISATLSKRSFESLRKYLSETGNLGEYWRDGGIEEIS